MSGLRFIAGLFMATPFVVFGAIMYVKIGNTERKYQAEMRQIALGQIHSERLTLVRMYGMGSQSDILGMARDRMNGGPGA
ncbi:MAG TPA: hypothetical protein VMD30_01740 [Tepidisphaeraceae bacterium]|nr:hypothetical protein [Tepidisphaeraceae bacterium]